MKKFKLSLALLLAGLAAAWQSLTRPCGSLALANELAGELKDGAETLQVDSAVTTPETNTYIGAGKNLVWSRGANSTAAIGTAQVCTGAGTKAQFPLGISPDAPFQAGDWLTVYRFGARPGSMLGISAGAITVDDWVASAASGLIQTIANPTASGSYWVIGKATKTVTAAGQQISFVPMSPPELWTVTNGTPNTYVTAAPL